MCATDLNRAVVDNLCIDKDRFSGNVASLVEFHSHRDSALRPAAASYFSSVACLTRLLSKAQPALYLLPGFRHSVSFIDLTHLTKSPAAATIADHTNCQWPSKSSKIDDYLRQGGNVFAGFCLSVCLPMFQQDNSKSYGRIFLKF